MLRRFQALRVDSTLRQRARHVIPGGMYGHQNAQRLPEGYPQFMQRGHGSRVWDVDGNEYIDLMCAYGPIVLGYAHPKVDEAAKRQQALADTQNGPSERIVELAETLVDVVAHADWALFAKNGTDATTMSLMVARATTGKRRVLVADGAYHGAAPWCTPVLAGTTSDDRANLVRYRYNDLASVDEALDRAQGDVAAILVSPFRHDAGVDQELADPAFARGVRERCDSIGAALILDDVRCGFRLHLGGSWEPMGVAPDISAWSKAIANGYPLAAVLGNDRFRDGAKQLFVTGSFWYSAVPMAAALATIDALKQERAIETMQRAGERLRRGLAAQAVSHGLDIRQTGPVQMPYLSFTQDRDHQLARLFCAEAIQRGIYLHPRHNWFVSAAHTNDDVDQVLNVTDEAFAVVARENSRSDLSRT